MTTIHQGEFSFELGEDENTFTNVTYCPAWGGKPTTLNAAAVASALEASNGALSLSDLNTAEFPYAEAAMAIQCWLAIQKDKFDKECFTAKTRGDPPPTWWPLW